MGKKLVIKGADFSSNGIQLGEIQWTQLSLTEGNWSGNYHTGELSNKAAAWWTSNAVDISSYDFIKGHGTVRTISVIYMFYTGSPTKTTSKSLFVEGGDYNVDATIKIPATAKYLIVMDGTGSGTYSGSGAVVYGGVYED